ncbi:MAG: hypothetical protein QME79_14145 [Bacillota bacterium]|nr:hypothetical protein [Bacillota bacterium]
MVNPGDLTLDDLCGPVEDVVLLRDLTLLECYPASVRQRGEIVPARWMEPPEGCAGFMGWSLRLPYTEGGVLKERLVSLDAADAVPAQSVKGEAVRAEYLRRLAAGGNRKG